VLRTEPRLPDGTPFPTIFYVTCPRLTGAISTLETSGLMREMTGRLSSDPELAAAYLAAHEDYLRRRGEMGAVAEIEGISAGGMPTRVKCLHVLVGHSLAVGTGVNPLGDEALEALAQWWTGATCIPCSKPGSESGLASGSEPGGESGSESGSQSDSDEGPEQGGEPGGGPDTESGGEG